jgi:hypothetical protein
MLDSCCLQLHHQVQLRHNKRKSAAIKELLSSSAAAAAANNDGSGRKGQAGIRAMADDHRPHQYVSKQPGSSAQTVLYDAMSHELWRAVGRLEAEGPESGYDADCRADEDSSSSE